jgi:beta-lactamase regulating signal transducer with metallopeptidase domain
MSGIDAGLLTLAVNAAWQVPLVAAALALAFRVERRSGGTTRARLAAGGLVLAALLPWTALARTSMTPSSRLSTLVPAADAGAPTTAALVRTAVVPVRLQARVAQAAAILYLAFLAYRALALGWAARNAQTLRRRSRPAPADLLALARDCASRLGLRPLDVRLSSDIHVPITLGVVRPLVLLPERLAFAAGRDALRAALAHEAAHVKRHDVRWHLGLELLTAPIAFHPATTALARQWHRTREEACDEAVVRHVIEPRAYASALVEVARLAIGRPAPAHP